MPTVTSPKAVEFTIVAPLLYPSPCPQPLQFEGELEPLKPPATLLSPASTVTVAEEFEIFPELSPAKPPAWRYWTADAPTVPIANAFEMVPAFEPTNPPRLVWLSN